MLLNVSLSIKIINTINEVIQKKDRVKLNGYKQVYGGDFGVNIKKNKFECQFGEFVLCIWLLVFC